jgi:hypothetical protein
VPAFEIAFLRLCLNVFIYSYFLLLYGFAAGSIFRSNTLLYPILPLVADDYEEFGYPGDLDDFLAIREYSPYDNVQKDVLYPAVLVSSSFNTR